MVYCVFQHNTLVFEIKNKPQTPYISYAWELYIVYYIFSVALLLYYCIKLILYTMLCIKHEADIVISIFGQMS